MTSLNGKIVLITGASSGIGQACAHAFAAAGAQLLLCARRGERLLELTTLLTQQYQAKNHYFTLDVRDQRACEDALAALPNEWCDIDILINNAGLAAGLEKVQAGRIDDWETMIDTNIKGLLYMTRLIIPQMIKRNCGHIINMGSLAGHETYTGGAVYCATKAAVHAINTGLKMDLLGTKVRVTSVDPGLVETEFSQVRFKGDQTRAQAVYHGTQPLSAADVADCILFCATRPAHVNIRDLVLMPTCQSAATLVDRREERTE